MRESEQYETIFDAKIFAKKVAAEINKLKINRKYVPVSRTCLYRNEQKIYGNFIGN